MNEIAWQKLQDDKANRQPTPPLGEPVTWYMGGNKSQAVAAQVTGIEGPGKIKVKIHPYNAPPQHKAGVYHISASIHEKPNPTTSGCGAWDYTRGKWPKEDYALHDAELAKREANLILGDQQAKVAQETFVKRQAEKKRLNEILPAPSV